MSLLAKNTQREWERRYAHAQGETFDPTAEAAPASKAALDVLWNQGHGFLTERQFKAGDWLRGVANGRRSATQGGERIQGGATNPQELKAVSGLYRGTVIRSALQAADRLCQGAYVMLDAICVHELGQREAGRRLDIHMELVKRRLPAALDALADYRHGCDADVVAWNAKAACHVER